MTENEQNIRQSQKLNELIKNWNVIWDHIWSSQQSICSLRKLQKSAIKGFVTIVFIFIVTSTTAIDLGSLNF